MVVTVVFGILACICLAYYIVIVSYAGIGSAFSAVWLLAGIFLAASAALTFIMKRKHTVLPAGVKIALGVLLGAAVIFFSVVEGFIISEMNRKPDKGLDYVIVLGAQVRGTRVTRSLAKRLDTAFSYMSDNPETVAVVSGGQGSGEDISEAQAMYNYLVSKGISKQRIIIEDKSTNTEENIDFSMELIQKDSGTDGKKIGVVTNNFHVFRAVRICEKKGYKVSGVPAPPDKILFVNYMVREFCAVVKYKLSGAI